MCKLHSADTNFIDCFSNFMNLVVTTLKIDAKEDSNHLRIILRPMGKSTSLNTHEAISGAFTYISAHKAIFEKFGDELNKYVQLLKN